jgi:adenylosuccinate synthase
MLTPEFPDLVRDQVEETNAKLAQLNAEPLNADEMVKTYIEAAERLRPYIIDTIPLIHEADRAGKSLLLEGAQGTMLDIDFGTYPFVTSSNPTSGGACIGSGLSPRRIDRVVGVIKAYTTRVGEGPFPTEDFGDVGRELAERGHEFGSVTGRPRRCGWFDAVVARYAQMVNGVDFWALTKLDVMDNLPEIKICVAYELDGKRIETMPASAAELARCKPIYETMPGWMEETSNLTSMEELPLKAKAYVERLIELSGGRLGILSIGPARESTVRVAL